ncbi:MAG TPA: DUF262 domain-containing protein [Polyangia bacterium]
MTFKRRALGTLTRADLLEVGKTLEVHVSTAMRSEELIDAIASSKRATLEKILPILSRDALKGICLELGESAEGREKQVIADRILSAWRREADDLPTTPLEPSESGIDVIDPPPRETVTDSSNTSLKEGGEPIDGLDEDAGWGDYPIDTVLIRSESRTVFDVVRRIEQGSYIMDPDFQRDFIWPEDKQSKLIESVLMRIPLPVLYLAEDNLGHMIVVDGLQRLSTFRRFLKNEFRLKLPSQRELDKKSFNDLSPKLKNRVEDCNLMLYVVDAKVPERARLDIFERVNGGVPLTRQQMRNCLYVGQATQFLKTEARTDIFADATGNSLNRQTMRDREFVNRFCAFHLLSLDEYKGEMDDFLANALEKMNKMSLAKLETLSADFRNALRNNFSLFGEHAFRKHDQDQARRSILNASIWDVMTTELARIPEALVDEHSDEIRNRFYALMNDATFVRSVTYSTNSANQVRQRFDMMRATMAEVLNVDKS